MTQAHHEHQRRKPAEPAFNFRTGEYVHPYTPDESPEFAWLDAQVPDHAPISTRCELHLQDAPFSLMSSTTLARWGRTRGWVWGDTPGQDVCTLTKIAPRG